MLESFPKPRANSDATSNWQVKLWQSFLHQTSSLYRIKCIFDAANCAEQAGDSF